MERATKTSLAIKMKMRAFFNFSAFISTNSPKMESWGRICSCVYVLQTSLQKELYGRVRTGCKEKRTGRANFVVFRLLIGLIAVAINVAFVVATRFIDVRKRL